MDANKYSYEILFIDDGSKDRSWEVITGLSNRNAHVRGFVSAGIMASPPPSVKASPPPAVM